MVRFIHIMSRNEILNVFKTKETELIQLVLNGQFGNEILGFLTLPDIMQLLMTKKIYGPFYGTYTQALNTSGFNSTSPSSTVIPTTSLNLSTVELFYKLSNRYRLGYRLEEPSNNHVFLLNTTFRF